jgi:DNA replication protein DnaC
MKTARDFFLGMRPPAFDHACPRCGQTMSGRGLCPACADAQRAAHDALSATAASIPERLAWASALDAPKLLERVSPPALAQVRALDFQRMDRVTLLGPAGCGKSSLAVALAQAWTRSHARPSFFVSAADLGVARQQCGLGEGEAILVQRAMGAALTIVDDLGVEPDIGAPVIAHLLHRRYDAQRPTIATTGLTIEQLASRYGAGVARRLVETVGGATVVKMGGQRQ